jgi:hypothetical protein
MKPVELHPLTPDRWANLVMLFGENRACAYATNLRAWHCIPAAPAEKTLRKGLP